jgi:tetratricopeptide (TPR) repeat protein
MRNLTMTMMILIPAVSMVGQTVTKLPAFPEPSAVTTLELAHSQLEHGKEREAIDALQQLAAAKPPVKGANRELGIAYYRTSKLVDAEQSFAAAMAEDPNDGESVQMRGLTLYRLGRPGAALLYLERARQWNPDSDVDVNYVIGRCYIDSQRYDDARAAFAFQYSLDPEAGAAYLMIAQILLSLELPEKAAENAKKALQISPNIALAHFVLGKVYLAKGDSKQALEQFEQERTINPTYPPLYQFLGDLYIKAGQLREAQHSLTQALSLDQSSTGPFILLGRVFLDDNDPQTAVSYLQHAEQMDSSNFITHYLLAQAYKQMGRTEDSKREVDAVSKIHSGEIKSIQ